MRLLHLADLHLGWEPSYLPEEKRNMRRRERDSLIEKAVDFALTPANDIHAVLIAGDLFENYRPEDKLVQHVMTQLRRLTGSGILVVTVPGNHDEITYRDSVYRKHGEAWPGELVRNPMPKLAVSREINGVPLHLYSLAYTGGLTRPEAIEEFPREDTDGIHLAAFHGSLDWEGLPDRSLPLFSSQLASAGYHYVALGHYHRSMEKQTGKGKAVYPGAVEFKSFIDPGTGKFTVVELNENGGVKLEKEKVEVRPHLQRQIDLSVLSEPEELLKECRKSGDRETMLRLELTGTPFFPVHLENLEEQLADDFFYVEISNRAKFFEESFVESVAREATVRGAFIRRMQKRREEASGEREKTVLEQAMLKGLAALEGSDPE